MPMRKNVLLLLTILWSIHTTVYAQHRSFSSMKRIAQEKLSESEVNLLDNLCNLYIYGNDKGFVIMNRDGESKAIIGYSHTKYDKSCLPEGLKWWLGVAGKATQVQGIIHESTTKRAPFTAVEPFIKSTWNQGKPYYYLCPKNQSGENCMTGCVATALSQVLYYYKYPTTSEGSGSYTVGDKEYEKSINTTYDWENMKDNYKQTELRSSAPVQAVAALMRDCGYATGMNYSAESSGAVDYSMALALRNNFKYDSLAIRYYDRSNYSDEEWKGMVYAALEKKMPVMYAGTDEAGQSGHEFLLCGIDNEGLVYVNWGWGGDGDGFFDLDALKYFGNEFNSYQTMVIGTRPQQTPDAQDKFESTWVADNINYSVVDEDVLQMELSYLFNYSILDFNGTIDLALENKSKSSEVTYLNIVDTKDKDVGRVQPLYGFYFVDKETDKINPVQMEGFKELAPGIYRMYLTCKEKRDSQRQLIRSLGGVQYATLKKLNDGTLLVSNSEVDDIDTGIQTVHSAKTSYASNILFNLKGQMISPNAKIQKSIYVVNGKKVIR